MDDKTRILPSVANADVGTQLSGIYELDERLASGGMGEVYRGHNIQTGDVVAIKIVLPEFARDQTILSLFRKEASILNHLSHDAIVRYHVFTIDPGIGRPYLAMEFVNGPSLFDIMRSGPLSASIVRRLCHRLASGLSAAHEAGTVHRDLSPDNIILPGSNVDRAKIIDFGIARSANVGGETLIGGRFAGKYNYVSPEQLGLFGGEVTEQSDIYSLGLVLSAALRGKPLDMSGSQFEIVEKRRSVPDLSDLDEDLRPVIEAMLQPDPRERPASMADIADATRMPAAPERSAAFARTEPAQSVSLSPQSSRPGENERPSPAAISGGDNSFVEHVRPAYLSQPKPPPNKVATPESPPKRRSSFTLTAASIGALAVAAGAAVYLTGVISFQDERAVEPAAPKLTATSNDTASPSGAAPANPPDDTGSPAGNLPVVAEAGPKAPSTQEPVELPKPPSATEPQPVKPIPKPTASSSPAEAPQVPAKPKPGPAVDPAQPSPIDQPDAEKDADRNVAASTPKLIPATPNAAKSPPSNQTAASPSSKPIAPIVPDEIDDPEGEELVMDLPKPQAPPSDAVDDVAERISWLRGYDGGNCFYATALTVTDKSVDVEGFGTAVEPFAEMLAAFQARFNLEPDINVRLIDPAQCEITTFLHTLGDGSAEKPMLALAQTSVPSGSPVSGTLETSGGMRSNLLLIDHKGMAFNLDQRVRVDDGKATFNIPIGLSEADRAGGKVVPQIIVAVTATSDIAAADFSKPTPASVVLPKILAEIRDRGLQGAATAKYFRLGG
ncbi:MAG: protein kinase [Rhizobiaceae bacterium]